MRRVWRILSIVLVVLLVLVLVIPAAGWLWLRRWSCAPARSLTPSRTLTLSPGSPLSRNWYASSSE